MSSADPTWSPPAGLKHRPHPAAYVLAVLLPLLLLAALAAPFGAVWWRSRTQEQANPTAVQPAEDGAGVGDPYFPDYGSAGYDALGYTVDVNWDPATETLSGSTVIRARATRPLDSLFVDFALPVSRVRVDGVDAEHRLLGFQDLRIDPETDVANGATFEVEVTYDGQPDTVQRTAGDNPWMEDGQEWTAAGEPESSAWWFPANDHPSDPATLDVSVRVPRGVEVISTGRLLSRDTGREPGFDTWRWQTRQPAVTYATFLSIGQFEIREGSADGRPFVYAVSEQIPPAERSRAFAEMAKSGAIVQRLEEVFGPYPFTEIGGVVPIAEFAFDGLETQTRPIYARSAILDEDGADRLLVHELAHMWFGDSVTLEQWNDIFLNEAYASWAEWVDAERTGGRSGNEILNPAYDATRDRARFWQITMIDPGRDSLFATVYTRGPMTVQALRKVLGEGTFRDFTRRWAQEQGPRSVEDWMAAAQATTATDLDPFFQAWIYGITAPARTAANGFR